MSEDGIVEIEEFGRFAPARQCIHKDTCNRMHCSFYHGDQTVLAKQFCSCTSLTCLKPHPFRAARKRSGESLNDRGKRMRFEIKCDKCGGPHKVINCPQVSCHYCQASGHMSMNCPHKKRDCAPKQFVASRACEFCGRWDHESYLCEFRT